MNKKRVAVIGCGAVSGNHIHGILEAGQEICALCDIVREQAEESAKKHRLPDIPIYTDYIEMLESVRPDAVHICTPHYLHAPMCVAALQRNIHVLCEKPLCINMEQMHDVLCAERNSRARLGVCQQNRFEKNMIWLSDFIGAHGVRSATGIVSWARDEEYYRSGAWRGKILEEGGGVMINQALHTLDLLQHVCGMPTHVTAHIANDFHRGCIDVEDMAVACFEREDSVRFHFYATNNGTADMPAQLQIVTADGKHVFATNNVVLVDGEIASLSDSLPAQNPLLAGKAVWGNGHAVLIGEFYRSIAKGETFGISGSEAARVVRLILSMYHSHGNRIKVLQEASVL